MCIRDRSTAQTPFGHDVPVYDMERTICDVLRSRSHIEMQTFQDALKAYARRKDKDLRTLVRYAKMCIRDSTCSVRWRCWTRTAN